MDIVGIAEPPPDELREHRSSEGKEHLYPRPYTRTVNFSIHIIRRESLRMLKYLGKVLVTL